MTYMHGECNTRATNVCVPANDVSVPQVFFASGCPGEACAASFRTRTSNGKLKLSVELPRVSRGIGKVENQVCPVPKLAPPKRLSI